jgi:DNA-binding XRE family transcriptional regulator
MQRPSGTPFPPAIQVRGSFGEMTDTYELEFFAEDDGTEPVLAWINNDLTATQRRAPGTAMRRILQADGVQVCSTPWGRQLGGGLFEFRVRRTGEQMINEGWAKPGSINPSERILLRVFCHAHGDKLILLLGGYDKGSAPRRGRQQREINTARARLRIHRARAALRSLDSQLHIAGQLLALRHRRGLTQRQLSQLSGIQQADISRIECGETQPTTVTARRLADALGADFGFYEIDSAGNTIPVEPSSVRAA